MDLARPNMKFAVDLDKAFVLWPLCPMERETVLFALKVCFPAAIPPASFPTY